MNLIKYYRPSERNQFGLSGREFNITSNLGKYFRGEKHIHSVSPHILNKHPNNPKGSHNLLDDKLVDYNNQSIWKTNITKLKIPYPKQVNTQDQGMFLEDVDFLVTDLSVDRKKGGTDVLGKQNNTSNKSESMKKLEMNYNSRKGLLPQPADKRGRILKQIKESLHYKKRYNINSNSPKLPSQPKHYIKRSLLSEQLAGYLDEYLEQTSTNLEDKSQISGGHGTESLKDLTNEDLRHKIQINHESSASINTRNTFQYTPNPFFKPQTHLSQRSTEFMETFSKYTTNKLPHGIPKLDLSQENRMGNRREFMDSSPSPTISFGGEGAYKSGGWGNNNINNMNNINSKSKSKERSVDLSIKGANTDIMELPYIENIGMNKKKGPKFRVSIHKLRGKRRYESEKKGKKYDSVQHPQNLLNIKNEYLGNTPKNVTESIYSEQSMQAIRQTQHNLLRSVELHKIRDASYHKKPKPAHTKLLQHINKEENEEELEKTNFPCWLLERSDFQDRQIQDEISSIAFNAMLKNEYVRSADENKSIEKVLSMVFPDFEVPILKKLLTQMSTRQLKYHEYLFPPEDLQEQYYMFIVCTGLMGVFSTVNNKLVNTLKPGQTFFESALATKPFDIHFRAIRSTAIIILKTNNFIHFLGNHEADEHTSKIRYLTEIPLFNSWTYKRLESIIDELVPKKYKAGEMIYEQGEEASCIYFIVSGSVKRMAGIDIKNYNKYPIGRKEWEFLVTTRRVLHTLSIHKQYDIFGYEELLQYIKTKEQRKREGVNPNYIHISPKPIILYKEDRGERKYHKHRESPRSTKRRGHGAGPRTDRLNKTDIININEEILELTLPKPQKGSRSRSNSKSPVYRGGVSMSVSEGEWPSRSTRAVALSDVYIYALGRDALDRLFGDNELAELMKLGENISAQKIADQVIQREESTTNKRIALLNGMGTNAIPSGGIVGGRELNFDSYRQKKLKGWLSSIKNMSRYSPSLNSSQDMKVLRIFRERQTFEGRNISKTTGRETQPLSQKHEVKKYIIQPKRTNYNVSISPSLQ